MLNPIRYYRVRRACRALAEMPPPHAAELLRVLIETGVELMVDTEVMAVIADRAAEGESQDVLHRMAEVYHAGRRVKLSTYEATLLREGETPDLIAEIEAAFAEAGDEER
jgi:hypothetical protein